MFYLHTSNKTENLLRHLAALLEVDPPSSIFTNECIVIQSQGMERMISQFMADTFISWCNYKFYLPLAFLQDIARKLQMEIAPESFDRPVLSWRIEGKLRHLENEVYAPLKQYLQGEKANLKRFQLARRLANIFDQYQLMRPLMLKDWEKGAVSTDEPAEIWQMHLWNRLVCESAPGYHRGQLFEHVIARLQQETLSADLPRRVSIFGLTTLPPVFLEYLKALSHHIDVHLFLLSPCSRYWGDTAGKRTLTDSFHDTQDDHPLLTSFGRQGRDFHEMLVDTVSFAKEIISYEDPLENGPSTLLGVLQSDLLAGKIRRPHITADPGGCFRIVSCHSRQRELGVLKDHILTLLDYDHSLELCDIVVMAPDIQEYAPFIPALFEDIQHSIADRSLRQRNGYISVFLEFLLLFDGRFGWTEVFDILHKTEVHAHFGITSADFERLQHWLISSGIRWGLTRETRGKQGFDFTENSWQSGLQRLLMGYAMLTEQEICTILPYPDIEGGDAALLGGLCEFVDLLSRAERNFDKAHSLVVWAQMLLRYGTELFGSVDDREYLELTSILLELNDAYEFHKEPVCFEIIRDWFEHSSKESRSASGFLKGQLTFCSMLPMRSIPFRAVCLIGLDYGVFPKNDGYTTFNLMQRHPQRGDRSLRADDRYQFLEALLSARENLYISYIGQSLRNNEELPPSVVVTELLEFLNICYGQDIQAEKHPLHPFSRQYFSGEGLMQSYSEENYLVARNISSLAAAKKKWWSGALHCEKTEVNLDQLLRFYHNPQRYFVEQCLGLDLGGRPVPPDNIELFASQGLESYIVDQTMLERYLQDQDLQALQKSLCQSGLWPLGTPGDLAFERRSQEICDFAGMVRECGMGMQQKDIDIDITIGGYRLWGMLTNLYEGGIFLYRYAECLGRDCLKAWLHHVVAGAAGKRFQCTKLLMKGERVCFALEDQGKPDLVELIDLYVEGCREPSSLLIEPGWGYCRQKSSGSAKVSPLAKARSLFTTRLEKGYEPSWTKLYAHLDPETVVDTRFEKLCHQVLLPLYGRFYGT